MMFNSRTDVFFTGVENLLTSLHKMNLVAYPEYMNTDLKPS